MMFLLLLMGKICCKNCGATLHWRKKHFCADAIAWKKAA